METLFTDWRFWAFTASLFMAVGANFYKLTKFVEDMKMSDGETIATHLALCEQKVHVIEKRQREVIADYKVFTARGSETTAKLWTSIDECKNEIRHIQGKLNGPRGKGDG